MKPHTPTIWARLWARHAVLYGACALAVAVPAITQAAALRKPAAVVDLQSTVDQTAAVVEGTVSEVLNDYSDEEGPWTRVVLTNVKTHLGNAPAKLEIRHFGGMLPNGRKVVAAELPVFVAGKRYVVFLRNTEWNMSPVVGNLALRVEKLEGTEVLVNTDGQVVTGVGVRGVELGPALFEGPQYDGTPSKALGRTLATLTRQPLDRMGLVQALRAHASIKGLRFAGQMQAHPAGEFKWRGTPTVAAAGAEAAAPQAGAQAGAEVDTTRPVRN